MTAATRSSETFATLGGALLQVRLLSRDGHECLLQNRDTDIRIKFRGPRKRDGQLVYRWYSEREERWVLSTQAEVLANTTSFQGWFEVRHAD